MIRALSGSMALVEHPFVAIHLAHHREQTYPGHNEFRPERFLDKPADRMRYLPFSIGSHACLGVQLTELETKLIVAEAARMKRTRPAGRR
ncbi:cytochrome P450 [Nocardia gipuzkoensis]|uniref:cytochrome P450 n=1 Tax=Nocardia gipuzkoensis TaxID=2749991 RepID=UPI003EE34025